MTETLAHGYSSKSTQRELSNEYQNDRVQMLYKNHCIGGISHEYGRFMNIHPINCLDGFHTPFSTMIFSDKKVNEIQLLTQDFSHVFNLYAAGG